MRKEYILCVIMWKSEIGKMSLIKVDWCGHSCTSDFSFLCQTWSSNPEPTLYSWRKNKFMSAIFVTKILWVKLCESPVHEQKKPNICTLCECTFRDKIALKRHIPTGDEKNHTSAVSNLQERIYSKKVLWNCTLMRFMMVKSHFSAILVNLHLPPNLN